MKLILFLLVLLQLYFLGSSAQAASGPQPASGLLVEYLASPVLGLDVTPRFSWLASHTERGQNQSAYSLTVNLLTSTTPFWSSGKVSSSQSNLIEYTGPAFQSDTSYSWQVAWWDSNDVAAPVSVPAYFDTGILNTTEWVGKWIGGANQLRKEFTINNNNNNNKEVKRARLFISGVGYYVARINGQRVGDHVLGPWTQYESRILYDVYDVGAMLVPGDNAIAVALGNGFYGHPSVNMGSVSLICQLSVSYTDGSSELLAASDYTWKVINGPVTHDNVYFGMNYDARLETPGWDKPAFNDSLWTAAKDPVPIPVGKLQAYLAYPQRKVETFSPINFWEPYPGIFVFDFGQNMAGWSQIRAIGPSGTMITIQHSEMVNTATNTLMNMYPTLAPMIDNFTLAGTGDWEYFEPEFVFHGFQYIQITGYPGVPSLESIQAFFIHSDLPQTGTFATSNDVINYCDHMTRSSAISNFQSIPSDCPTREKRGWLGDAQVSGEVQMQYWDMGAAYTKFIQDIHDSQVKIGNGNLGDTAPWYDWGASPADPAWGTAFTLLWYWQYVYYNDTRALSAHYDNVKWYISTLTQQANNVTGLLEWSRYGDWCSVADNRGAAFNSPVVSSFYYILQLEIMVEISELLNQPADTAYYSKLLTNSQAQFNPTYFNAANNTYNWGFQTMQILPIVANLVEEGNLDGVVNYLLNDVMNEHNGHLTVGIVGAKYLLGVLTQLGRADVAWTVATQVDYPSWENFATQGGTTLWENWGSTREVAQGSRNHIMFGGQATWYYQSLAGISMTPGTKFYQDITINPVLIYETELSYASASIGTYKGQIYSSWYRDPGLCTSVPENSNASLSCSSGVITSIDFASFGVPFGQCGDFQINTSCNSNISTEVVSKLCLGKSSCSVPASRDIFNDPCVNVFKKLSIQASGCDIAPYNLDTIIPFNTVANVVVSKFSLSNATIYEGTNIVWQNGKYKTGTAGILYATDIGTAVVFRVGGGSYNFKTFGSGGMMKTVTAEEGETFEATCPEGHVIARIKNAHFGSSECSLGSSQHMVEKYCLNKNECSFVVAAKLFGDTYHNKCGQNKYTLNAEIVCSRL